MKTKTVVEDSIPKYMILEEMNIPGSTSFHRGGLLNLTTAILQFSIVHLQVQHNIRGQRETD
jgi:hypothetical protein